MHPRSDALRYRGAGQRHPGCRALASGLAGDRRGAVAILFAIMLPVILGFIGLGVEVGSWFLERRTLQTAADTAAISAALEVKAGSAAAVITAAALRDAGRNGYNAYTGTLTVANPPASGAFAAEADAVEVRVTAPRNLLFSALFAGNGVTIGVRSVAMATADGEACVLALDTTASPAIQAIGSAVVNFTGCNIATNSAADDSVSQGGTSILNAECVTTVGGISGTVTTTCPTNATGASPIADPYSGLSVDAVAVGGCDNVPSNHVYTPSDGEVLVAGTYCKGIKVNAGVSVTFGAGTYYLDGGGLSISGGATVTGTDVTFVATSQNVAGYGAFDISGGATVNLSAPTTGVYSGILFYQDQDAPTSPSLTSKFNGGTTMELGGVIYIPNNAVEFSGGNIAQSGCTKIAAKTIKFGGNADINNNCGGSGTGAIVITGTVAILE